MHPAVDLKSSEQNWSELKCFKSICSSSVSSPPLFFQDLHSNDVIEALNITLSMVTDELNNCCKEVRWIFDNFWAKPNWLTLQNNKKDEQLTMLRTENLSLKEKIVELSADIKDLMEVVKALKSKREVSFWTLFLKVYPNCVWTKESLYWKDYNNEKRHLYMEFDKTQTIFFTSHVLPTRFKQTRENFKEKFFSKLHKSRENSNFH